MPVYDDKDKDILLSVIIFYVRTPWTKRNQLLSKRRQIPRQDSERP